MHETAEAADCNIRRQWAHFRLLAEPAETVDTAAHVGCAASAAARTLTADLEDIVATAITLAAKYIALQAVTTISQAVLRDEMAD